MRRRKRPETLQRVYKFRAYPVRIPEQHWVIAKSMQALWNQLVYQRAVFAEYVDTLNESARRGAWAEFEGIVDYLVRRSGLNWEWAPAVVDRFRSACIAAARGQRQPPQTQRGLRRIMIPHRFTGGGIPVEKLFSDRAERIRIERPPDGAYRDNSRANRYRRVTGLRYGLGAEAIEARVRLHREIDGLVVKGVAWCGERVGFDWEWYLTVTVEQERCQRRMTGIDCGVDVGWRQCDDGSIRMAMITDSGGHTIEARLPTYLPNAHSRRHDDSISLHGWADLRDLDRQMASLRKETDSLTEYRRLCSI